MTGNAFEYDMLSKSSCCPNIQFDKFHISSILIHCIWYICNCSMEKISKHKCIKNSKQLTFIARHINLVWKIVVV